MRRPALPSVGRKLILVMAGFAVFLALTFHPAVNADGVGYFSYLHAVLVDHNLNMSGEYAAALKAGVQVWTPQVTTRTPTGLLANQFPVGPALLSTPAYLVALAVRPGGRQFAPPFTTAYTLASLFFGLLALTLAYRLARMVIGSGFAAATAAVAVGLASPLLYYLVYQPSYSHAFSAFMVTAFLFLWWTGREARSIRGWLLLGLVGGLMALVRWQDGPLMLIALVDVRREHWRLLLMLPGALLGFSPQLVVDRIIFGTWLPVRPAAEGLDPLHGHYLQVLFGSWHGLFTWTPILILATLGILLVRDMRLRAAFAIAFIVELFITGAYPVWWGGFGFGMRYLIDLTPFFVIGLAAVFERIPARVTVPLIGVLTAWSLLLIANVTYVIRNDVDPGYVRLLADQVHAVAYLPHLLQGDVVRGLILWPALHQHPNLLGGVTLLLAEIAIVAAVAWVAMRGERAGTPRLDLVHANR